MKEAKHDSPKRFGKRTNRRSFNNNINNNKKECESRTSNKNGCFFFAILNLHDKY